MAIIQGDFTNVHGKVAIVVSRFNEIVTQHLVDGAVTTLMQFGIQKEDIDVYWVPGAFELGYTAKKILDSNHYDGIMSLGAVIKGETDHYAMIINQVTSAIMQLDLTGKIPVTFGVLTTEAIDQALQS